VVFPSLLIHGKVEMDRIGGHARAPTKPHVLGVYDNDGVGYLSCARVSCVPRSSGGIRRGVCNIL
jgi:hypothetical protein